MCFDFSPRDNFSLSFPEDNLPNWSVLKVIAQNNKIRENNFYNEAKN